MKIFLVYSTQMGTTLMAVEHMVELLKPDHSVLMKHAMQVDVTKIPACDLLIVATPNYDDGMPEPALIPFLKAMGEQMDMAGREFAVLNLGDSSYPVFATAGLVVSEALNLAGMKQRGETLTIDGYMYNSTTANEQISTWVKELVNV